MSTFAAAFREIVMPRLRDTARTQGLFVALNLKPFSSACAEVWAEAGRRGAYHLPTPLIEQLNDWIGTQVLSASIEFEPTPEQREQAERVWRDVKAWDDALIAREATACLETI